jgi:hypothetical protein
VSARFTEPAWDGALRVVCFVRLLAKGPQSVARGAREAGSGSGGGAAIALMDDWAVHPATGSPLPSEGTALPLRGRIRFVAFRASHPAKPSSRSR